VPERIHSSVKYCQIEGKDLKLAKQVQASAEDPQVRKAVQEFDAVMRGTRGNATGFLHIACVNVSSNFSSSHPHIHISSRKKWNLV